MDARAVPIDLGARGTTTARFYASDAGARPTFILAHGAGAGQHSAWIVTTARALAALGIHVVTFNFPYTEQKRRLPDRAPVLEDCYRAVIETVRRDASISATTLFAGGKSMGGRIATQVAAADPALPLDGLVLLGYPLHPPGRPDQRRDAHLPAIRPPALVIQGSRDAFGNAAEMRALVDRLPRATLHIVEGGDHSFKVAGADAERQRAILDAVYRTAASWIADVTAASRGSAP